jgi:hypothetical protein
MSKDKVADGLDSSRRQRAFIADGSTIVMVRCPSPAHAPTSMLYLLCVSRSSQRIRQRRAALFIAVSIIIDINKRHRRIFINRAPLKPF